MAGLAAANDHSNSEATGTSIVDREHRETKSSAMLVRTRVAVGVCVERLVRAADQASELRERMDLLGSRHMVNYSENQTVMGKIYSELSILEG